MPIFEGIFAVRKASFIMALPNLNTRSTARKKTSSVDVSAMMYGKIPPQARELEEAILGGILLEKSAFDTVTEILKPECFYVEAHQMIFQSMQSLQQKNMPIDMLTVVE
jgi:replicative DNA helicase